MTAPDPLAGYDPVVISLERTPERLDAFIEANRETGLRFKRFTAIDGLTVDRDALVRLGLIVADLDLYSRGSLGCALSHRALWRHAVKHGRGLLVFEDDAVLRRDFPAAFGRLIGDAEPGWDILLLGYNTDSVIDVEIAPGCALRGYFSLARPGPGDLEAFAVGRSPVVLHRLTTAFGLCGYAISARGAERLLELCFPLDNRMLELPAFDRAWAANTFDARVIEAYAAVQAFACVPPLVMTANDPATSTTLPGRRGATALGPSLTPPDVPD